MTKIRIVLRFGFSFCRLAGRVLAERFLAVAGRVRAFARRILPLARRVLALARCVLALAGSVLSIAGCATVDVQALASEDDRRYRTDIFTWLVEHEPSAVVVWHVPVETVRILLPQSRIFAAATTKVCTQALRSHALLLLVEPRTATRDREDAEDCGFALERDAGAIVIAPR